MNNYRVHFFEPNEGATFKNIEALNATAAEIAIKTLYPNATGISTVGSYAAEAAEEDHARASFGISYDEEQYMRGRASGRIPAPPCEETLRNWYVEWHREHPEGGNPTLPTELSAQFREETGCNLHAFILNRWNQRGRKKAANDAQAKKFLAQRRWVVENSANPADRQQQGVYHDGITNKGYFCSWANLKEYCENKEDLGTYDAEDDDRTGFWFTCEGVSWKGTFFCWALLEEQGLLQKSTPSLQVCR